ncbi:MAG: PAS domain S-box protein [bacterium]|nr:PAS domain S-box protein [bacterium]
MAPSRVGDIANPSQPDEAPAIAIERARQVRAIRELETSESYSRALFHAAQTGLIILELHTGRILDANHAAAEILGATDENIIGHDAAVCGISGYCERLANGQPGVERHQAQLRRRDGQVTPVLLSAQALTVPGHDLAVVSFVDISDVSAVQEELRKANRQLESALHQLHSQRDAIVQSEKLASIGQLAAGVAHEINNPIGYITSNLATISEYIEYMRTLLILYRKLADLPPEACERPELEAQLAEVLAEEDVDYVLKDIDAVLSESVEGTTRVTEIVQNLKSFARDDSLKKKPYDLNECVESMIRLVWNELKYSCTVEKDLDPVPPLNGHGGQINQVIMNILVNAAHAIGAEHGTITIRTRVRADEAELTISDTGCGMPAEVVGRVFEPFFTTKDVGRGTGLGLSISHGIVTDHGGRIEVESVVGEGTTFRILLPLPDREEDILII